MRFIEKTVSISGIIKASMVGYPKLMMTEAPLDGKTVLLRADYNVPLDKQGHIEDDYRITQSLPTLQILIKRGCKIVICSHLGRPKGKVVPEMSLKPVATRLSELLGMTVTLAADCIGDRVVQKVKHLQPGHILLLENLRFHDEEEANDETFARQLARDSGAQYFIQDGFGVVHRAHASTSAITQILPSVSGLLLRKEWVAIETAMQHPKKPTIAVLGGAKISDKIKVIERFINIADTVVIGGAMANTFLEFKGYKIGKSVYEEGLDDTIKAIYKAASEKVGKEAVDEFIILPTDVAVSTKIEADSRRITMSVDDVSPDEYILDLGPNSIETAVDAVRGAGTVIWNGTLGYAELPQFSHGSARMALALASQPETTSVIGGGDTADFVLHWDAQKGSSFSHVSTGGGASLDLMAGEPMPGIDALLDA